MDSALHSTLLAADVEGYWEYPPGYDYDRAMARVRTLKPDLESLIGFPLELDEHVQDASFLTDLAAFDPPRENIIYSRICIRFSNFGNFVCTTSSSPVHRLEDFPIAQIETLLRARGYYPLPSDVLDDPYDGVNAPSSRVPSWWFRYFDYI